MGLIDFILNLAGLLLWLNWLSIRFDPLARPSAATLIGTLRRTDRSRMRRWAFIASLAALLLVRAFFYWSIGSALDWHPTLNLVGTVKIFFPLSAAAYFLGLMVLYSVLSFGKMLAGFYIWLVLLSFLGEHSSEGDPILRLARAHLGPLARWPWPVRLVLPFIGLALAWLAVYPVLNWLQIVPPTVSWSHRLEQAALVGVGAYLEWKYLICGLLVLHILNSYVYLGSHPVWNFVTTTAQGLLLPLRRVPLRVDRADFAPLVGIAAVSLVAYLADYGWNIPFTAHRIPGLADLYERLPF